MDNENKIAQSGNTEEPKKINCNKKLSDTYMLEGLIAGMLLGLLIGDSLFGTGAGLSMGVALGVGIGLCIKKSPRNKH